MKNIKFTVSKNVVTLPEVEGVDSFLIEGSKFQDSVSRYEDIYFKAAEYSPGTKVTVDADSFKQITVYAIIDGERVFLRRAKINAPWTGIFDENYVSPNMFLEQATETTFPKAIIEDEQVEEVVEIEEAIAVADEYKNADENFLQEKSDAELSDIVEKATLINHAELVSKASEEIERRKNTDEIEDEQEEISVDKWDDYNADARIAILKEIYPNVEIILDLDENSMSLGRVEYRSTVQVNVNPLHLETTSFDEFCEEFDTITDLSSSRKHKVEARVFEVEEVIEDESVVEPIEDVDPLRALIEPLEPGTPEYYRHWLLNASTDEIISDLISLVNSLKQGKVRYSELEAVQKELVDRMGGNTDYKFEALVAVLIESRNGSHQEEVEKRVNDIKTQIEEHMEEGRRFQHEYDVFKGVIRPDPLDELLDDIRMTITTIENYGDEFMNWINEEQGNQPF